MHIERTVVYILASSTTTLPTSTASQGL